VVNTSTQQYNPNFCYVPFILLKTASQFSEFSAGIANRLLLKDGVQNT